MAKIFRFPTNPDDRQGREGIRSRAMVDGKFYDLNPPSRIGNEIYDRVQCEDQVPNNPNEYIVRGIPRGGTEPKSFVLRFNPGRGIRVTESEEQKFQDS